MAGGCSDSTMQSQKLPPETPEQPMNSVAAHDMSPERGFYQVLETSFFGSNKFFFLTFIPPLPIPIPFSAILMI